MLGVVYGGVLGVISILGLGILLKFEVLGLGVMIELLLLVIDV